MLNTESIMNQNTINCQQFIVWDRTKAMPLKRAFGFRNCLAKNPKMMFPRVVHPHLVQGQIHAYVEWMTSSVKSLTSRYGKLQAERLKRAADEFSTMDFVPIENTKYQYLCTRKTEKGETHTYVVSENECECTDFRVRCWGTIRRCKHQICLKQVLGTICIDELSALLVKQEQMNEVCHA